MKTKTWTNTYCRKCERLAVVAGFCKRCYQRLRTSSRTSHKVKLADWKHNRLSKPEEKSPEQVVIREIPVLLVPRDRWGRPDLSKGEKAVIPVMGRPETDLPSSSLNSLQGSGVLVDTVWKTGFAGCG